MTELVCWIMLIVWLGVVLIACRMPKREGKYGKKEA